MIHIETKSALEKKARADYAAPEVAAEMVAGDELAGMVAELLALRHKMDEDELKKSVLMGKIMDRMKNSTILKAGDGRVIATWSLPERKTSVDYKGLLNHLKATNEDILKFSTTKVGARKFELIEDQSELKKKK